MANFCHQCTFELFGDRYAPFNDFVNPNLGEDFIQDVLCEGCGGSITVDQYGHRLEYINHKWTLPELCPHGVKWELCRVVSHREEKYIAYVSALNFHGVGEFIALYADGDASSDEIKLYVPTCNTWENIDRLLTP